ISACGRHYQTLDSGQVDLSFAGRLTSSSPSLAAIQRIRTGDPVRLQKNGERWSLIDRDGTAVGRLARSYAPPRGAVFLDGYVTAAITARRGDSEAPFHHLLRRDRWEVVLAELVFEAAAC